MPAHFRATVVHDNQCEEGENRCQINSLGLLSLHLVGTVVHSGEGLSWRRESLPNHSGKSALTLAPLGKFLSYAPKCAPRSWLLPNRTLRASMHHPKPRRAGVLWPVPDVHPRELCPPPQ